MKQLIFILLAIFLVACSDATVKNDVLAEIESPTFQDERQNFLHSTGYVDLIGSKATSEEFKSNYIEVTNHYDKGHEYLNQYRLNVINHMVAKTDFLDKENDYEFLMSMYTDFQTIGGLETKYLLLNKLAEHYPATLIDDLRSLAYEHGLEYQKDVTERLISYEDYIVGKDLTDLEKMTLEVKQKRVNDAKVFLDKLSKSI